MAVGLAVEGKFSTHTTPSSGREEPLDRGTTATQQGKEKETYMKLNFKEELEKLKPGQVLLLKQMLLQKPKTLENKKKIKCIDQLISTYK